MQTDLINELNEQQQEAVINYQGPMLILAGAGSGKTKTLTHKIAYLLLNNHAQPHEIMAVTFTNKAAKEMKTRLDVVIGREIIMPYLGTFHSICVRLLRKYGSQISIPSNFVIYDETDKKNLIKRILKDHHLDEKKYPPSQISSIISSAKNDLMDPEEYVQSADGPLAKIVYQVYEDYQKELKRSVAQDFDDLIMNVVRLLRLSPPTKDELHARIKYIFIDEYQDTNQAQYQLVKLLVNNEQNITVVGDDWQSIYSWRGADFRNILKFEKDFKNAKVVKLEKNYRSTKNILDSAHKIISKNTKRSDKKLFTEKGDGSPVQIIETSNERDEGRRIAHIVQHELALGAVNEDIAVLYRTNAQSRSLEEAMIHYQIPYKIVGGLKFYDRKEIKDILAYLRLAVQPEDQASFQRIYNVPTRKIGEKSLANFYKFRSENRYGLTEALANIDQAQDITPSAKDGFLKLYGILKYCQTQSEILSVQELIEQLIKNIGYQDYLEDGTVQGESRQENVRELLSVASQYQGLTISDFLEDTALLTDMDDKDKINGTVTLTTIHASKGLEFPIVIISGMEEGIFPHSRSIFDATELEEERRLCYVGMTRAKSKLYLTHASSRMIFGKQDYNIPSRFLGEIDETSDRTPGSGLNNTEQKEEVYIPDIEPGDAIDHALFGRGTVLEVEGSFALIYFKGKGNKKINLDFAPVKKYES